MAYFTTQEDQIIIQYYGRVPINELLDMLPCRTEHAIRTRIRRLRGTVSRRKGNIKQANLNSVKEIERDPIDSYSNQLYIDFVKYIERAKRVSSEQNIKLDISHMMRVFRDIHGRFSTDEEFVSV